MSGSRLLVGAVEIPLPIEVADALAEALMDAARNTFTGNVTLHCKEGAILEVVVERRRRVRNAYSTRRE